MLILCKTIAFICILLSVYSLYLAEKWYQKVISIALIFVTINLFISIV
jgi:multisubunit Na+/H+ antiporter MnhC subunit